jgi:PAS domain S-box-containing protein
MLNSSRTRSSWTGAAGEGLFSLADLFDAATACAIVATDLEGRIVFWNAGARRMFGFSAREATGLDSRDLHPEADRTSGFVDALYQAVLDEGRWEGVIQRVRRNGEMFASRDLVTVVRDPTGAPAGYLLIAKDVTDEERLHLQLRESEEYNRGLIDASADAQFATDPSGTIADLNRQMEALVGYSRDELVGRRLSEFFPRPETVISAVERTLQTGSVTDLELELQPRHGAERRVSFSATVFRDAGGRAQAVLGSLRDVTGERDLEARLRGAESYNRGLLQASPDALVAVDPELVITDANEQMVRLSGHPARRLVGSRFPSYFADPEVAAAAVRRTLERGTVRDVDLTLRSKGGSETPVSLSASILRDTADRVAGVLVSARDITEQVRLRNQLERRNRELEAQNERVEEANRLKSEFLAGMSHELRTPLNSIIGFSEFLLTGPGPVSAAEQREYLEDILKSGDHLLQLINDVLDVAKIESGRMALYPEPFSPRSAIGEVCASVKRIASEKRLAVSTTVSRELASVTLDPVRFKQILYNLLSNAVKFTDPGGRVRIRARPLDTDRFQLEVSDSGIGIARGDLSRLFREFEQLDSGPARRYGGSGLGLSLTKKLVELHGGTIDVRSRPGRGTTFRITLPLRVTCAEDPPSRAPGA